MKLGNKEKFHGPPNAVFFDLDNTLYAYDPAHRRGMETVRGKMIRSFSLRAEVIDKTFEKARDQIKVRLGHTAAAHSRLLYFQRMLELMGLGSQILIALDLEQTYWRSFLNEAHLFHGVHDFLDDLRLYGIPMAIVTDLTAQIQFRKIIHFDLDRYVDCVVTSEEAGQDKPHGLPFTLAKEKLSLAGNTIWMVGDNPLTDVVGGKAAGITTIQKLHGGLTLGTGEAAPDASFHAFSELRAFVKNLMADP